MHVDDLFNDKKRINENLRKWFKEKWVRFGPDGKIRGDCARGDDSEGKPKCLPQSKAHALGKKGRKTAASRKRREDPNPERSGPAINVKTKESQQGATESIIDKISPSTLWEEQEEDIRQELLKNPRLFENTKDFTDLRTFLDQFGSNDIKVGNSYVYSSVASMTPGRIMSLAHFSNAHRLVGIKNNQVFFDINGKIQSYPESGGIEGDLLKQVLLFPTVEDFSKFQMLLKLKFSEWILKTKILDKGITESLDSPYSYHWEEGDFGDLNAYAQLSDNTVLDIEFEQINVDKSQWTVGFQRDGQIHKTGKGDEQRVFATVLSAIKEFIENKQPKEVFFSAEKSEVNPESRKRLYDRLVQKYATALGYRASQSETNWGTKYKFLRIREQGVAEGSGFDQEAGIGIDGKSFKFKIRDLVALADNYPVTKIDPQQFSKQIAGRDEDSTQSMARAEKADLQYPIIVVKRQNGQLWIADGTHRAHKAIMHKLPSINAKIIPIKDMAPFDVDQGVAEGIFDFKKQPMPEHGDELKIGDRYVIFDDGGSYYGVSWIKKDRSEAYEEFNKSEYTDLNELKKAIWDEIKYQDQRGMAEDFTDDLDNIYAMHPQPEKSEQVVFLITGMTEDEFSNRWTDLPDPYQQEFGHDLPLWDADDLSSYPNLAVKRITFDQYVQLVGNYIKSEELAGSTMSRMKQGMTEGKHSCPECGGPAYEDRMLAEKQDACYHKVKSRYKVWPSAYASGALVQCRKKGAKNWGNKKTNESSYYHGDPKAEYFGLVVDGVVKFKFTDPVLAHEFASGYHEQFPDSSIKVKKINKTDNIEEDTGKSKLINQLLKIDPSLERNYLELANIDQLKIMLQQHQNKGKIYFDVPKSLSNESVLRSQFKFKHDSQGWYLNESNTNFKKLYLDAARAFRLK